jgi:hypothetical protein
MWLRRSLVTGALAAGCSGDAGSSPTDTDPPADTDDSEPPVGLCGDVTQWDLTVLGRVRNAAGSAAIGAAVRIEDRVWIPGMEYGSAVTNAMGEFEIPVTGLVAVEDCWGLLGYYAVAELGEASGETGINSALFSAIYEGGLVADLTDVPIELEDPTP